MSELPPHFCPGCGAERRPFLRYPWYFCKDCLGQACDGAGRTLEFGNVSFSGGFAWRFGDSDPATAVTCTGVICLIRGRPVIVHEARFGGIVAEPFNSAVTGLRGYWRLTRDEPMAPRD